MQLPDAVKKLHALIEDVEGAGLDEAVYLCAHDLVSTPQAGIFLVRYGDGEVATVQDHRCDCDPLRDEPGPVCVHIVAAELYTLLRDVTPQADVGSVIIERHIERVVSGALCTESPYSLNCTVEDVDGYNLMFTVRKSDSKEFFGAVQALRGWLKDKGYRPVQRGYRPAGNHEHEQSAVVSAASAPGQHADTQPPRAEPVRTSEDDKPLFRFHAETLHRNELDGRILFAVKGPDMHRWNTKYGTRIWQETLTAAGFDVAALETMPSKDFPSLKGWVAEYTKQDGEDRPDKIVRLVKSV